MVEQQHFACLPFHDFHDVIRDLHMHWQTGQQQAIARDVGCHPPVTLHISFTCQRRRPESYYLAILSLRTEKPGWDSALIIVISQTVDKTSKRGQPSPPTSLHDQDRNAGFTDNRAFQLAPEIGPLVANRASLIGQKLIAIELRSCAKSSHDRRRFFLQLLSGQCGCRTGAGRNSQRSVAPYERGSQSCRAIAMNSKCC